MTSKGDMYRRLAAGEFGNTSPQFFDLASWGKFADASGVEPWGIRTMTAGGGPSKLDIPAADVGFWWARFSSAGHRCQVSAMVDDFRTAVFNVWDSPTGLVVEGREWVSPSEKWRDIFAAPHDRWSGVSARVVLRRHLNANSSDDLDILLAEYPDHVVEMSVLCRCFGTVPHRNAVVWELRAGGVLNRGY